MKKVLLILLISVVSFTTSSCAKESLPEAPKIEISEEARTGSAELIMTNPEIKDAEVIVEDNVIKFYMVPTQEQEVTNERLRQLGVDFIKLFAGYMSNEELAGPSDDSYGQIYDYYDVEIIVEGERGSVLERGTKAKGEAEITWEQQQE